MNVKPVKPKYKTKIDQTMAIASQSQYRLLRHSV